MELNKQEASYILDGEKKYVGRILRGDVLNWYYETERLLRGLDKPNIRGCNCEYRALAANVHSLIGQHRGYIESIVNGQTES